MFGNKKHEFKDYGGDFMLSINADIEAFRSGSQVSTQVMSSIIGREESSRPMRVSFTSIKSSNELSHWSRGVK